MTRADLPTDASLARHTGAPCPCSHCASRPGVSPAARMGEQVARAARARVEDVHATVSRHPRGHRAEVVIQGRIGVWAIAPDAADAAQLVTAAAFRSLDFGGPRAHAAPLPAVLGNAPAHRALANLAIRTKHLGPSGRAALELLEAAAIDPRERAVRVHVTTDRADAPADCLDEDAP